MLFEWESIMDLFPTVTFWGSIVSGLFQSHFLCRFWFSVGVWLAQVIWSCIFLHRIFLRPFLDWQLLARCSGCLFIFCFTSSLEKKRARTDNEVRDPFSPLSSHRSPCPLINSLNGSNYHSSPTSRNTPFRPSRTSPWR